MPDPLQPHVTILYHYFHPDEVAGAKQLSGLAKGLQQRGWQVTAHPCNRSYEKEAASYSRSETWQGVKIKRVWRPAFKQASNVGRLLNAIWMLSAWSWKALVAKRHRDEVVVIGTDPIFGLLAAIPWHLFRRRTRVVHWCFDLYPEAAVADGLLQGDSLVVRAMKRLMALAYRSCSLVVDIGPCMVKRLKPYDANMACRTLTPWALVEPDKPPAADSDVRKKLFGTAKLAILYSGSFGRAHSYEEFLALARLLRDDCVHFCFAGRGNRADQLKEAVGEYDTNIHFAGFASESDLEKRLTACDLHMVSLREEWTGMVVPSKFFGALAVGRGVLYAGSPDSAIAGWIGEHETGWLLTKETVPAVAEKLRQLARDPSRLAELQDHCHRVYQQHFSKRQILDQWDRALRNGKR